MRLKNQMPLQLRDDPDDPNDPALWNDSTQKRTSPTGQKEQVLEIPNTPRGMKSLGYELSLTVSTAPYNSAKATVKAEFELDDQTDKDKQVEEFGSYIRAKLYEQIARLTKLEP